MGRQSRQRAALRELRRGQPKPQRAKPFEWQEKREAAPVYVTKIGDPSLRDQGPPGPILKPTSGVTAFADVLDGANWHVYRSQTGTVFAIPAAKRDGRDKDRPEGERLSGERTPRQKLNTGAVRLGTELHCSMRTAVARYRFIYETARGAAA